MLIALLRRRPLAAAAILAVLGGGLAAGLLLTAGGLPRGRLVAACRPGTVREVDPTAGRVTPMYQGPGLSGQRDAADAESARPHCVRLGHPEPFSDVAQLNSELASRSVAPFTAVRPGAFAHAVAQRRALAAQSSGIPGTGGTWTALGVGPQIADDSTYDQTAGSTLEGFVNTSGRIEDFDYDASRHALYAAPVNGGIWESTDMGGHWRSVGDGLPTQVVASVKHSSAGGGTLVVLTGDPAFGGDSSAGLGAYWSDDDGASWHHSSGIPSGILGFQLAVDPTNPSRVYAATGNGLYRSTDAGHTFTNVMLPVGSCAGHSVDFTQPAYKDCYLANMVTDVIVQGKSNAQTPGATPGAVMAVVGWRAGDKPNADGKPQSPANGIYVSNSGAPNSFTRIDTSASGFAAGNQSAIGRTALGIANGPTQDHQVVYALVEDANRFNGEQGIDANEVPTSVEGGTVLNGVYVTTDFGHTWHELESSTLLTTDPTSGSALSPGVGNAIGYLPGVQAWYNEWIAPDPTVQSATGIPTRLAFGLEEVWENTNPAIPLDGSTPAKFDVIGRYWDVCQFEKTGLPKCTVSAHQPGGTNNTTTHPDEHAGLFVPDANGKGVTLVVGNDGGAYTQHVDAAGAGSHTDFDNDHWGTGANGPRGSTAALHTLQPYDAEMAKDGTTYAGLQDNGELKIDPDGTQREIYGGDGFFTAVDPDHSNVAYEEYTGGIVSVTQDGGKTWMTEDPALTSGMFVTPFKMDPTDANHLMIGGRDIEETTLGPNTVTCADPSCSLVNDNWQKVYDLGTQQHPGDASAPDSTSPTGNPKDPNNQLSAVDLLGDDAYVGYCGFCDTLTQGVPFHSGIATNVGGSAPPKRMTSAGWHIAAARGLPQRIVTSIAIDPSNPRTVYVTLGGYGRHWAPPGSLGDSTANVGTGHVFKSTDAGEDFTNISGNLPDAPADWVLVRNGQLVVSTDVGVFASSNLNGSAYGQLGSNLPNTPVLHLELKPGDPGTLVAATYGRGVYTYRFANPSASAHGGAGSAARRLRLSIRPGRVRASRSVVRFRLCVTTRSRGRTHRISGATVTFHRHRARTGRNGCTYIRTALRTVARYRAQATKRGYTSASAFARAYRRGSARFTG